MVWVHADERASLLPIDGELGAIMGMSQEADGEWGYAVHIYSLHESWSVGHRHLTSTGQMAKREDFYTGDRVRVSVDGEIVG